MEHEFMLCPFCGTSPEVSKIGNEHTKRMAVEVRCPECRVERADALPRGHRHGSHDWLMKIAAKNWNRRPANAAALEAENAALREKVAAAEARTVPAQALTPQSAVEKMLETNQLDELGAEVARLQTALCFWLPSVTDREDEVAIRILDDAFLLVGIDGNLPSDFKSAQELGWIHLAASAAPTAQEDGS